MKMCCYGGIDDFAVSVVFFFQIINKKLSKYKKKKFQSN